MKDRKTNNLSVLEGRMRLSIEILELMLRLKGRIPLPSYGKELEAALVAKLQGEIDSSTAVLKKKKKQLEGIE